MLALCNYYQTGEMARCQLLNSTLMSYSVIIKFFFFFFIPVCADGLGTKDLLPKGCAELEQV